MTQPIVTAHAADVPATDGLGGAAGATSRKNYGKKAKVGAMWSVGRESVTQLIGIPTTLNPGTAAFAV